VKPAHTDMKKLPLYSSARVGLTLNKTDGERTYYIMKPYRFMSFPKNVEKGKILLFLALYKNGKNSDEILTITGCRKATAEKYFETFDASKTADKDSVLKNLGKKI